MAKAINPRKRVSNTDKINRIKAVLLELDVTQKELAEKLGLSVHSVTRFCNNHGQPTLNNLKRIATVLEVNIQDLLNPTPAKKRD